MNVTGDRTAEHGLASVGYDDEGVAGQSWDLIRDGVLAGYQLDRRMAALRGFGRSNGCAFSDGPGHMPLQRMANVSLQPAAGGLSTANLRWAGNTLTTNGVAGSRQLTVIAIDRRGAGNGPSAATGVVSRAGVRPDQIEDVVREAEHAAAEATPAEDAGELIGAGEPGPFGINDGGPGWDGHPGRVLIHDGRGGRR